MTVLQTAFYIGLFSASTLLLLMTASVFRDNFRFWPPGSKNGKWLAYWILSTANVLSITVLFSTDLKTFTLGLNNFFSILLIFSGLAVTLAAIKQLGLEKTSGIKGEFMEKGIYRYSRNPQVLGNLITLAGVTSFLQTLQGTAISLLTGLWLIMMVFSEEKWLQDKYGEKYSIYRKKVPRYF